MNSCVSIKLGKSLLKTIGDIVGSLNSRLKNSDDDAAAADVDGCGVMCAAADVEASGVLNAVAGVHAFDVAADDIDIVGDAGLGSCCEAKYA